MFQSVMSPSTVRVFSPTTVEALSLKIGAAGFFPFKIRVPMLIIPLFPASTVLETKIWSVAFTEVRTILTEAADVVEKSTTNSPLLTWIYSQVITISTGVAAGVTTNLPLIVSFLSVILLSKRTFLSSNSKSVADVSQPVPRYPVSVFHVSGSDQRKNLSALLEFSI
jgi:hypothetical protein